MRHALTLAAMLAAMPALSQSPMEAWAAAWRANDRDALAALYAPDARVISAFTDGLADGPEAVAELLARETPVAAERRLLLGSISVRGIGAVQLASGNATAVLTLPDGSVWRCPLRLSLVFVWGEAGWRVVEQHTSFAPFQDE